PLLIAPDGSKLSKRKHGAVVSVTTYRDGGFLPHSYVNFLCLLGWSPKNDREVLTRQELIDLFTLEGVNRSNPRRCGSTPKTSARFPWRNLRASYCPSRKRPASPPKKRACCRSPPSSGSVFGRCATSRPRPTFSSPTNF